MYELLGSRLAGLSRERRCGYSGTDLPPWALVDSVALAEAPVVFEATAENLRGRGWGI